MAAAQWWAQANEEENRQNKEQEELFVFGYACKLFRDDEKAVFVDRGKHLIPWMSDDRLLIDRSVLHSTMGSHKKGFDLSRFRECY